MQGNEPSEPEVKWSVYSCAQNLSAILNDPKRGRQKDFFTRTWGESFVEKSVVPASARLEDVPNAYFIPYYRKLLKRYQKLLARKSSSGSSSQNHSLFPVSSKDSSESYKAHISNIPKIYFSPTFSLTNLETFREVYGDNVASLPSKQTQDQLSHYLDSVEVGLAQQISKKSSAFFSAVSTQDKVADKVAKAIVCVQKIKKDLKEVKTEFVETPFQIVKLTRNMYNLKQLYQKLQLMSTVHQAQRAIQSLLGNSDYVGALDLIATTQEVLSQELQGLVSFRHLDSQLVEIRDCIEKMLRAELERTLSANLNRPVEQMISFIDRDRLVSILLGHLRLGKIAPIATVLSKEISTAMTATCKQTLIEAVSESDSKSDTLIGSNAIQTAIPLLSTDLWIKMVGQLGVRLVQLLQHIKELILLFQSCADSAIGQSVSDADELEGAFVNDTDEPLISAEIFKSFSAELSSQLEKTTTIADEKFTGVLRSRMASRIKEEFFATLKAAMEFLQQLESFASSLSKPDNPPKTQRYTTAAEMKRQTSEFSRDFHQKQTEIVNMALDREKWRPVKDEKLKQLSLESNGIGKLNSDDSSESRHSPTRNGDSGEGHNNSQDSESNSKMKKVDQIVDKNQTVKTAEVFFIMLQAVTQYCHLVKVTCNPEIVMGVVDLLRVANARIAHLVLSAGAVELGVCKSITVANLAVVVRGLCFIADTIPIVRQKFHSALPDKSHHLLKQIDAVHLEFVRHSEDVESKMISIMGEVIDGELVNWEARPPVPSAALINVSKSVSKFREAIGPVLTQKQITGLFMRVDKVFRTKLKDRIAALGIQKDGGPRHGVVTSEMMHYAENLRKLNVLPANVISNSGLTNELWA